LPLTFSALRCAQACGARKNPSSFPLTAGIECLLYPVEIDKFYETTKWFLLDIWANKMVKFNIRLWVEVCPGALIFEN
jgi:hypothetical protein